MNRSTKAIAARNRKKVAKNIRQEKNYGKSMNRGASLFHDTNAHHGRMKPGLKAIHQMSGMSVPHNKSGWKSAVARAGSYAKKDSRAYHDSDTKALPGGLRPWTPFQKNRRRQGL